MYALLASAVGKESDKSADMGRRSRNEHERAQSADRRCASDSVRARASEVGVNINPDRVHPQPVGGV